MNAWGLPFTATLVGARQVMPGAHLDAESLLEAYEGEKVTFTAGVPTIFLGVFAGAGRGSLASTTFRGYGRW